MTNATYKQAAYTSNDYTRRHESNHQEAIARILETGKGEYLFIDEIPTDLDGAHLAAYFEQVLNLNVLENYDTGRNGLVILENGLQVSTNGFCYITEGFKL